VLFFVDLAMRKGVAAIFLTVFLLSNTELHQFLKLPVLFEHFREHRLEDPSISFMAFLEMHYENIVIDADYQRDQQLPFRDIDCDLSLVVTTDIPPQSIRIVSNEVPVISNPVFTKQDPVYSHQYLSDIFQPPRLS